MRKTLSFLGPNVRVREQEPGVMTNKKLRSCQIFECSIDRSYCANGALHCAVRSSCRFTGVNFNDLPQLGTSLSWPKIVQIWPCQRGICKKILKNFWTRSGSNMGGVTATKWRKRTGLEVPAGRTAEQTVGQFAYPARAPQAQTPTHES